jgi:predicted RNase H-like HicB family nuclease
MATAIAIVHEQAGVYGVSFPDFPGAVTTGANLDEAVARAREMLAFHVEGMVEDGEVLPALRTLGEIGADPTLAEALHGGLLVGVPYDPPGRVVRVNISIDERLLEAVDRAAKAARSNRSAFLAESARKRLVSGSP